MNEKIHTPLPLEEREESPQVIGSVSLHAKTEERAVDPKSLLMNRHDIARFWGAVNITDEDSCWTWKGSLSITGYGRFMVNGKRLQAHRISAFLMLGSFPGPTLVLHNCDNPPCVNPFHLRLGNNEENMADMVLRNRSPHGTRNAAAILHPSDVMQIRSIWALDGRPSARILGLQFGVSEDTILKIVNNRIWKRLLPKK